MLGHTEWHGGDGRAWWWEKDFWGMEVLCTRMHGGSRNGGASGRGRKSSPKSGRVWAIETGCGDLHHALPMSVSRGEIVSERPEAGDCSQ